MVGDTTLKASNKRCAVLGSVLVLGAGAAVSNQLAGFILTGHVTAASTGDSLSLDGRMYRIKAGSPAMTAAQKLTTGTVVDAVLDGPPATSASAVINIVVHADK